MNCPNLNNMLEFPHISDLSKSGAGITTAMKVDNGKGVDKSAGLDWLKLLSFIEANGIFSS